MRWLLIFWIGLWCQMAEAQTSKIIHIQELKKLLADPSDSLTVINFWATWCKPCVAELPHFQSVEKSWKGRKLRFWYISLDFAEQKKTRLDPFIKKRKMNSNVFLLDEVDYNTWLPLVDKDWQGNIPATLFVNNSKNQRKFVEGELSLDNLNNWISKFLTN